MENKEISRKLRAELEHARQEFHAVSSSLSEEGFRQQSLNPGWTNGEVLFHITLGFMLMPILVPIVKLFGRLPKGVSKSFAAALNFSTPFFNWINGLGPRGATKIYHKRRIGCKFDKTMDAVVRTVDHVKRGQWQLSMAMPNRWDPMFGETRTVESVFYYMIGHMRFHFAQISPSPSR